MKMTKKEKRIAEVLDKRISILHRLAELSDNETQRGIYIDEAFALRSCMRLICEDNYLEKMEEKYL